MKNSHVKGLELKDQIKRLDKVKEIQVQRDKTKAIMHTNEFTPRFGLLENIDHTSSNKKT